MKKIIKYLKRNKSFSITFGVFLGLFIILSLLICTGYIDHIDNIIHSYILKIRSEKLTSVFKIITNFAGASFLLAISLILLILTKKKIYPLFILINTSSSFLVNELMKNIFIRHRPVGIGLILEKGYSYPSGQSMVSLAFYGFITYLLFKKYRNKVVRIILFLTFSIIILLIGFSRIYLGVHYLSDVIGGFLLAISYLLIYIKVINMEKK